MAGSHSRGFARQPHWAQPGLGRGELWVGRDLRAWRRKVMSTITIPLPDEALQFLRAYSQPHGTSAEAFLAQQARNLREHLQRPLEPEVEAASGIILPEVAAKEAHRAPVETKRA